MALCTIQVEEVRSTEVQTADENQHPMAVTTLPDISV